MGRFSILRGGVLFFGDWCQGGLISWLDHMFYFQFIVSFLMDVDAWKVLLVLPRGVLRDYAHVLLCKCMVKRY